MDDSSSRTNVTVRPNAHALSFLSDYRETTAFVDELKSAVYSPNRKYKFVSHINSREAQYWSTELDSESTETETDRRVSRVYTQLILFKIINYYYDLSKYIFFLLWLS